MFVLYPNVQAIRLFHRIKYDPVVLGPDEYLQDNYRAIKYSDLPAYFVALIFMILRK